MIDKFYDSLIQRCDIFKEEDDFVIFLGENERWQKIDNTADFEYLWRNIEDNIELKPLSLRIGSINITLIEKSRFLFLDPSIQYARKISECLVLPYEGQDSDIPTNQQGVLKLDEYKKSKYLNDDGYRE